MSKLYLPKYNNFLDEPLWQAGAAFGLFLIGLIVFYFFHLIGVELKPLFQWRIAATMIFTYTIFNSTLSLHTKNPLIYYRNSIYSFMGLVILTSGFSFLLSGTNLSSATSFKAIYIALTIGYIVFIVIIFAVKKIVTFAQKEEWNAPTMQSKKRR